MVVLTINISEKMPFAKEIDESIPKNIKRYWVENSSNLSQKILWKTKKNILAIYDYRSDNPHDFKNNICMTCQKLSKLNSDSNTLIIICFESFLDDYHKKKKLTYRIPGLKLVFAPRSNFAGILVEEINKMTNFKYLFNNPEISYEPINSLKTAMLSLSDTLIACYASFCSPNYYSTFYASQNKNVSECFDTDSKLTFNSKIVDFDDFKNTKLLSVI